MSWMLSAEDRQRIVEALEYMSDVFMPEDRFNAYVSEGYGGTLSSDDYTMSGDDLAGFCWHFDELLKFFGVSRDIASRHS